MKTLITNPGAKRLMESLRNIGYDCSTAIADLVDNSIVAGATEIHIDINAGGDSHPSAIIIADNGKGMSKDELHEAMRFGSHQEYSSGDLGKYGLGLKTASLSQCRRLTVSSKAKPVRDTRPHRHYMRWDVDHVYETNNWNLLVPSDNELKGWEKTALEHKVALENGTVVLWTKLDEALPLLSSRDDREREKFIAHLIEEVSKHIGMVFHRFMQGVVTGHRKLNIYVCGEKLNPWDPFCREEKTKELDIVNFNVVSTEPDGSKLKEKVIISPFVLPREDEFSSPASWKVATGPKNWNQQQGLYFYRNNRLLQAGGWSRLRAADEHTKLLRIAVDFTDELDRAFSINITKMRARIPAEIRDKIGSQVSTWAKIARSRYDGKSDGRHSKQAELRLNQPDKTEKISDEEPARIVKVGPLTFIKGEETKRITATVNRKSGIVDIIIPSKHSLAAMFLPKYKNSNELQKLCLAAFTLLELIHDKKLSPGQIPIKNLQKIYRDYL